MIYNVLDSWWFAALMIVGSVILVFFRQPDRSGLIFFGTAAFNVGWKVARVVDSWEGDHGQETDR